MTKNEWAQFLIDNWMDGKTGKGCWDFENNRPTPPDSLTIKDYLFYGILVDFHLYVDLVESNEGLKMEYIEEWLRLTFKEGIACLNGLLSAVEKKLIEVNNPVSASVGVDAFSNELIFEVKAGDSVIYYNQEARDLNSAVMRSKIIGFDSNGYVLLEDNTQQPARNVYRDDDEGWYRLVKRLALELMRGHK